MSEFQIGTAYFRLTLDERQALVPFIETFVFIGKSMSDADPDDLLYFQNGDDYCRFGPSSETGSAGRVRCLDSLAAAEEMLDPDGLCAQLRECRQPRN